MLTPYGKPHTTIIAIAGAIGVGAALSAKFWLAAALLALLTVALLAFFRDPMRETPSLKDRVVAPADGRIREIETLEHFDPLVGPAVRINIYISMLDVHITRAPMYGRVASVEHVPGQFLNTLRADAAAKNQSTLTVFSHPAHDVPLCAVRQITGAFTRRIVADVEPGDILQRGQRYGMIKFGSSTDLYLPHPDRTEVHVRQGQRVRAGETVLATVPRPSELSDAPAGEAAQM